ncbi:hypothetical protein ACTXT7_015855 [Hymenolepis weldensis]
MSDVVGELLNVIEVPGVNLTEEKARSHITSPFFSTSTTSIAACEVSVDIDRTASGSWYASVDYQDVIDIGNNKVETI